MAEKERHFLQWHITHKCNLRCAHCYQDDYSQNCSTDDLFEFLDEYEAYTRSNNYSPQINLTGGEPLLHPDFFSLAASIKSRGMRLGVLTNGTVIDSENAKRLAYLKPVFVQVSLDGTREIHDAIRGNGSFDSALAGIDLLKKHGVKVLVSFTAQKGNHTCFSALAAICRKHGVDKLWWDRVVSDDTETLALSGDEFMQLVSVADKTRRRYELLRSKTKIDNGRALQFLGTSQSCRYTCSPGKNLLIFLPNGDVMPCRRLPFVIGNLKENPLETVLAQSDILKELFAADIPEECKKCPWALKCRGGAKCVTYAQTGNLFARDVNCPVNFSG